MEAVKVLLVDDEVEFVETLGQRLEARGLATTTAATGDEALEKLRRQDFDVVLLDLFMPGRDGLETLREIKLLKPLTEVIVLSGRGSEQTAIEGMKRGAFDFLTKPPDVAEIVEKITDARAKRAAHLARIRRALEAGRKKDAMAVEEPVSSETSTVARPIADGVPRQGRLLVVGRESGFSKALIEYALEMAARLSYELLALNAAGFSREALRAFPSAWNKVCEDFRTVCEENVVPFQRAAAEKGIPLSHVVKFSGLDEAIQEIRHDMGEVDFVVSEPAEGLIDSAAGPNILVYSPA